MVPAMTLSHFHIWGDSHGQYHTDGMHTYTQSVNANIRWPLTRFWVGRGWIPGFLRYSSLSGQWLTCGQDGRLPSLSSGGCTAAYQYGLGDVSKQSAYVPFFAYITGEKLNQRGMMLLMQDSRKGICEFFAPWIESSRVVETEEAGVSGPNGSSQALSTISNGTIFDLWFKHANCWQYDIALYDDRPSFLLFHSAFQLSYRRYLEDKKLIKGQGAALTPDFIDIVPNPDKQYCAELLPWMLYVSVRLIDAWRAMDCQQYFHVIIPSK